MWRHQLPARSRSRVSHRPRGRDERAEARAAQDFWITVREEDDDIVLSLRDNGVGFDTSAPGPEGHFGMAMMRERAQVGGGRFEVFSAPGQGATITVRFPTSLLQQEPPAEAPDGRSGGPEAGASPGTPGTAEPAPEDPRRSVRA